MEEDKCPALKEIHFLDSYNDQWMNCPGQLALDEPAHGVELNQRTCTDPKSSSVDIAVLSEVTEQAGSWQLELWLWLGDSWKLACHWDSLSQPLPFPLPSPGQQWRFSVPTELYPVAATQWVSLLIQVGGRCPTLGSHPCMVTLMGQVSTVQPKHKLAFPSKTHLVNSKVVLHCQTGPLEALAWDQSARTRLCWQSSPTTKGHWGAATQQPEHGRAGTLCSPGVSALHNSTSPSASGKDMLVFLVALQFLCLLEKQALHSSFPHHSTSNTFLAPQSRHKAAILAFARSSTSLSRLLALNVLYLVKDKEWKKGNSDASAAQLGEQSSGTDPRAEALHGSGSPPPGVRCLADRPLGLLCPVQ